MVSQEDRLFLIRSPGSLEMFQEKIKEFKTNLYEEKEYQESQYKIKANCKEEDRWWQSFVIEMCEERIKVCEAGIRRFVYLCQSAKGNTPKTKLDVDEARSVVLSSILGSPIKHGGGREMYRCPLHEDSTPSFVVYKDSNRWWCFGACGEGGSAIDLVMKMDNCDFKSAVRKLNQIG